MKYRRSNLILGFSVLAIVSAFLVLTISFVQRSQQIQQNATGGFTHVVGTQIVDENGNPLILHGAQLEGELNGGGNQVPQNYTHIISTMQNWHMNAIRLPSCNWFWKADPTGYMAKIQSAVNQANQAGLYVIIDLHDDHNCNPPYVWPEPYHLPRPEMDTYWQAVATALKNNPKVIFDIYNEPNIAGVSKEQYTDAQWKLWLNGGTVQDSRGTETFIGMQRLVDVIRQTGAQQTIMVEGYTSAETFHNIGNNMPTDPLNNIVAEAHKYSVQDGAAQWDTDFGFMGAKYPVFVGEWALMGGDNSGNTNCGGITSSQQADQVVSTFLSYMDSHHMGWTAYSFDAGHLIIDYTNFTPTSFFKGWVCPSRGTDTINNAGMGADIKNYLANAGPEPSITHNPTPTFFPTPTQTITPFISTTPRTTFLITVCPHGLGNCGDNANPAGGNTNPQHASLPITLTLLDSQNQQVGNIQGTVTYDSTAQNFQGQVPSTSIPVGSYLASLKVNGYLSKLLPGIQQITPNTINILPPASLTTGDANNDNQLDIFDYNIIISCFGTKQNTSSCLMPPTKQSPGADLTDDGTVDGADYNLFLRELSVQKGGT